MPTINVLNEILAWSAERPLWQRDALRRLVTQGELSTIDVSELTEFCKASHGLANKTNPEPLEAKHLPQTGAANNPVALTLLTHRSGVNALAQDQTIEFGSALTVVYGGNAAGKSGYTRILKRACRARGAEEILGNVVSGVVPGRPAANIRYLVNGASQDFAWDDDKSPDRFLSRVSVFDRHCAGVYIAEETDVAFRPLGLDLFDKLSSACEAVRGLLERERRVLEITATQLPEVAQGTVVHNLLSHLTSLTNTDDVQRLATLTEAETAQIEELRARLRDLQSDDPQKRARALDLQARRVDTLVRKAQEVSETVSDEAITSTVASRDRVAASVRAAEEMRHSTFEGQPLPNTGSQAWRAMWTAAERFSTTDAYPEETFPFTGTNSRCVLCQQKLKDDGIDRLQRFHDFLNSAIQRERDEAVAHWERARKQISDLIVFDPPTTEALDELQLENPAFADALKSFLDNGQHRRVSVLNALNDESVVPSELPPMQLSAADLRAHGDKIRSRANELRGTNKSDAIRNIEVPLRELEARQVLASHVKSVLGEVERKKCLAAYQLCLDEAKTNPITRKSSEVTKVAVTEQLAKSFKDELARLKFRHVEVEMVAAGGSRGTLYHKLQLRRAPGVSVPNVVSEGEARCLSIASFFAELSTAADQSAILFDDPVSSLDHNWRANVASRLVAEASSRHPSSAAETWPRFDPKTPDQKWWCGPLRINSVFGIGFTFGACPVPLIWCFRDSERSSMFMDVIGICTPVVSALLFQRPTRSFGRRSEKAT